MLACFRERANRAALTVKLATRLLNSSRLKHRKQAMLPSRKPRGPLQPLVTRKTWRISPWFWRGPIPHIISTRWWWMRLARVVSGTWTLFSMWLRCRRQLSQTSSRPPSTSNSSKVSSMSLKQFRYQSCLTPMAISSCSRIVSPRSISSSSSLTHRWSQPRRLKTWFPICSKGKTYRSRKWHTIDKPQSSGPIKTLTLTTSEEKKMKSSFIYWFNQKQQI